MLTPTIRKALPEIAAVFSKHSERALSTIGVKACGNSSFFTHLKAGKVKLSMHSVDAVLVYMARDWPAKAAWPKAWAWLRPSAGQLSHVRKKPAAKKAA